MYEMSNRMSFGNPTLFDKQKGRKKSDEYMRQEKMVHMGYRRVHEDDKARWVHKHFDAVAGKYDFMNTLLSFGIHRLWKRTAVRTLGLNAGSWVIDVCGGTGDLSILAARAVGSRGRVVLYDINRAMMEEGRRKCTGDLSGKCIKYVQGDAERISFPDQRFDAAMVGFGIRNLTHIEQGLREIYRVLKPGGKLMCLEFSRPTAPLFRWLYDLYSYYIIPRLGGLIVGSREAYTYLPQSIRMFFLPHELTFVLKRAGFSKVTYQKLTNGIAVIHLAKKVSQV